MSQINNIGAREETERRTQGVRLAEAWSDLLGTPEGRLIMCDIVRRCGVMDVHQVNEYSAFNEGRRAVGVELMQAHLHPANVFGLMLLEEEERQTSLMLAREMDQLRGVDSDEE